MTEYPGYVLITGAGGGLGLSLVDYFLSSGIRKIACQYRLRHEELANLLKKYDLSFNNHCFRVELTDELQVKELREKANQKFGKIWGLINLAGESTNSMSWKLPKNDFLKVVNSHLLTTFLCSKEFIPDLRERMGGRIINISSVVAFSGTIGAAHYCAAKAGVVGFTKAIALELADKNVRVNAVVLGYYQYGLTSHIPPQIQEEIKARTLAKRYGKSNEFGGIIKYLLSDDGDFATGQSFHINGGIYLA